MKILIVSDHATVSGGASAVALASVEPLRARGHTVTVWTPQEPQSALTNLWNRADATRFKAVAGDYDLVHVHSWAQYSSSSIFPVIDPMPHYDGRTIVTLHDYAFGCPNGVFFNHQSDTVCRKTPLSLGCLTTNCDKRSYAQKLFRIGRHVIQRHVMTRYVKHVIVVSGYSHARLQPFLTDDMRVHHVANPVLVDPCEPASPADHQAVVMVGAITKGKGALLLAQATASLQQPVVFVGDGPDAEAVMHLNPQARLTGWADREKVLATIRQSRALIFPALWEETEGLSVLEAQACGVPAIVSNHGAARHSILDGQTGLTVRPGSLSALTQALCRMHEDDLAARLGRAAHARYWASPRTLSHHVDQLERVYQEVMA